MYEATTKQDDLGSMVRESVKRRRDEFAMAAMPMVQRMVYAMKQSKLLEKNVETAVAEWSYAQADAMLAEREK